MSKIEVWKPLQAKGYEGLYFISSYGRVKNIDNRLKKAFKVKEKYVFVTLNKDTKQTSVILKNLVALHFIPNRNKLKTVFNIDGDLLNNHVSNLRWGNLPEVWNKGLKEPELTLAQKIKNLIRQHGGREKLTEYLLKKEVLITGPDIKQRDVPSDSNFISNYFEKEVNYCHCEIAQMLER
ncbi:MAG: hypothetical protein JWR05_3504 [Mucilaginibacter sp.]|nr:hypothetical protein [Mucilaginibacter sp.]